MKLNHINIRADIVTLEVVKDFYCDVLGFEIGDRPKLSISGYWLYSEGAALIHLQSSNETLALHSDSYLDHVAFEGDDLQSTISRLNAQNIDFGSNYIESFNLTQLFFLDPVGNKIEINFAGEQLTI